ncbi:hypothetical protein E0H35_37180, partial [Rhizobium leguminosarum bv. viciae]
MKTRFDSAVVLAASDVKALQNPFMNCLVRLIRAKDLYGLWSDDGDAELLAKFTTTLEQRRALPIVGDLDPFVLWRLNGDVTLSAMMQGFRSVGGLQRFISVFSAVRN